MWSRIVVILLLNCAAFGVILCVTSDDLRVTLSNGSKLLGKYLRSHSGRPIKAFTSIPYAKPPVGDLRFKAPQPIDKWDGEYKAVKDGPICTQRDPFTRSDILQGQEDCLYLNVYVPHSYEGKKTNLPVLFYVHGGGFMCGAGIRTKEDPGYFLDHDVILVAPNYRLGPLGFLSTEDEYCPGNFGLKDQVMALKWVQQNIGRFGGNPESVTIFGGSAGGASVTYLMASPLAEGLFSKGIAQSGTNLAPWSQPAHKGVAVERATQLAKQFDCYMPNDWPKTINCLRDIPATNITAAFSDFFEFDTDPMVPFSPVVEPDLPGAFITKHPRDGLSENSLKIPFITGITFDEGLMKSAPYFNLPDLFDNFINQLELALPIAFYYDHHDSSVREAITNQIKDFYFDGHVTKDKELNLTNLFSDGWFLTAMDTYLRLRFANQKIAPTYVYLLTHPASASFSEVFHGHPEKFYGVSHADEVLYMFPRRETIFPHSLPTKEDEEIREAILQLFVDFARTGNPTPDDSTLPKWEESREFPLKYYRIGTWNFEGKPAIGMESGGLFEERANFWRKSGAHLPSDRTEKDEL